MRVAGWHLMGTARMGTDPETSVVNEWGRCHDVKNLFIIDGSIFPTAGAVNPTNTIQALALHVADTMKKNLANLFDRQGRSVVFDAPIAVDLQIDKPGSHERQAGAFIIGGRGRKRDNSPFVDLHADRTKRIVATRDKPKH